MWKYERRDRKRQATRTRIRQHGKSSIAITRNALSKRWAGQNFTSREGSQRPA